VCRNVFCPVNRSIRRFFAKFPGAHTRSCRRIRQLRRKNVEFVVAAQSSGHTSPVALSSRNFEIG
jgi:hypothetical protein